MKLERRVVAAAASVAAIFVVVAATLMLAPPVGRVWLFLAAPVAIAMSISSVAANPRELVGALVFAVTPLVALVAGGTSGWIVGPLGVLLLVGSELNAWSWNLGGPDSAERRRGGRGGEIARLAALGLVASVAVEAAAHLSLLSGTVALGVAAAALIGLARVVLPSDSRGPPSVRGPGTGR